MKQGDKIETVVYYLDEMGKSKKIKGFLRIRNGIFECVAYYYDGNERKYKSKSTGIRQEFFANGKPKKPNEVKLKEELNKFISEVVNSIKETNIYDDKRIFFYCFFRKFALRKKRTLSPSSFPQYYSAVRYRIAPFFNGKYLNEITTEMIDDYYNFLKFERKNSNNTIKHYHIYLKEVLNYAYQKKLIKENPATFVKINKVYPIEKAIYDLNEVARVLSFVKNSDIELPIMLAVLYGLRRSEALGLKWEAIDLEKNIIFIKRTVSLGEDENKRGVIKREETKTHSSTRLIPFTERLKKLLLQEKEKQRLWKERLGNTYNTEWDGYVLLQKNGKIIYPSSITRKYKKIINSYKKNNPKDKINYIPYRNLRTSCATNFKFLEVDEADIGDFLGHAIDKTTHNFYIQEKLEFLRKMVEKLEKELETKEKENTTDNVAANLSI